MVIAFTLCLPRDRASVPVVRHLLDSSLTKLGVEDECLADIELAVTEACTNVLQHSTGHEEYEVSIEINDKMCEIRVTDAGQGFDHAGVAAMAPDSAESGRGIQLMKALVDRVQFMSKPEEGTIVHLEKELVLQDSSILRSLGSPAG
jgi:serine/threonine-protein kinase RsbW